MPLDIPVRHIIYPNPSKKTRFHNNLTKIKTEKKQQKKTGPYPWWWWYHPHQLGRPYDTWSVHLLYKSTRRMEHSHSPMRWSAFLNRSHKENSEKLNPWCWYVYILLSIYIYTYNEDYWWGRIFCLELATNFTKKGSTVVCVFGWGGYVTVVSSIHSREHCEAHMECNISSSLALICQKK